MSISKRIADGTIMDLNTLVVALWGSAELLKYGKAPDKDRAIKRLEGIKEDIRKLERDEGLFIEGLQLYYHFSSDEIHAIELSKFSQYIKAIEEGHLDNTISDLRNLNNKLEEKVREYFSEKLPQRAYL